MAKIYNKLVRDKIPQIIQKSGNRCVIATLSDKEYNKKLNEKLLEELKEWQDSNNVEELCDIAEVLYALASVQGVSESDFEHIRLKKKEERGGFSKKILLERVEE